MKGLWMKDFLAFKKNAKIFFFFLVIAIFNGYTSQSVDSVFIFMTFLIVSYAPSTIFLDQKNHGMSYIFTLPIRKNTYIIQKQLLTIASTLISIIVSILLALGVLRFLIEGFTITNEHLLILSLTSLFIGSFYGACAIPMYLKFGSEHSQTAMFVVLAVFLGTGFLIEGLGLLRSQFALTILQTLSNFSLIQLSIGVLVIVVGMMMISTVASQRLIRIAE